MTLAVHVVVAVPPWWEAGPDVLSPDEHRRVAMLREPADRAAAAASVRLLRLLLARLTGVAAGDHAFVRRCVACGGPHGKPELQHPGLHTSRSWTRDAVAVAVTTAGPVGVDVEREAATDFDGFAGVALAPGESAPTAADRARAWTRKEAVLKAAGLGLAEDLRAVRVTAAGDAPALVRWDRAPGPVQLRDVPAPPGLRCAVAVLTSGPVALQVLDVSGPAAPAGPTTR